MDGLCSLAWDDAPATGTATRAAFWVALEQPGPWGAKAFVESRLDPAVGAALEKACADAGGRALLIRRVGPHADADGPRRVLVSGGPLGAPWLLSGEVDDPASVLDLPFDALAEAVEPPAIPGLSPAPPQALVCTNAKRDTCCAVRGRPVADLAARLTPGQVWECSHTGGHRFAPTAVVLPTGQLLGHATAPDVASSLTAAADGRLHVLGARDQGRSQLAPLAQVAEGWVREREGLHGLADVTTTLDRDVATVTHVDGRTWRVRVTKVESGEVAPVSCDRAPELVSRFEVTPV